MIIILSIATAILFVVTLVLSTKLRKFSGSGALNSFELERLANSIEEKLALGQYINYRNDRQVDNALLKVQNLRALAEKRRTPLTKQDGELSIVERT